MTELIISFYLFKLSCKYKQIFKFHRKPSLNDLIGLNNISSEKLYNRVKEMRKENVGLTIIR